MKYISVIATLAVVPSALAFPLSLRSLSSLLPRQAANANEIADNLVFGITLEEFNARRDANDPAGFDFQSDGCTSSPDRPFGFEFVPACFRHDFGYNNFRLQNRFTESNKARIDEQFHKDLLHQCSFEDNQSFCETIADVYFNAVQKFGGDDATPGKLKIRMELEGKEETIFEKI